MTSRPHNFGFSGDFAKTVMHSDSQSVTQTGIPSVSKLLQPFSYRPGSHVSRDEAEKGYRVGTGGAGPSKGQGDGARWWQDAKMRSF